MRSGSLGDASGARRTGPPAPLPAVVEEVGDLGSETLRAQPQLEDRAGLDEPRVGQLVDQRAGVAEGMDGIAVVADDQRRRAHLPAQRAMRRRATEEQPLKDRRARPWVLPDPV